MSEETSETSETTYGLGDDIDDWCTRCRGLSGHAVTVVEGDDVTRVMCRACLTEHKYRKGKGGKSKQQERQKLIDEVLKNSPFRS